MTHRRIFFKTLLAGAVAAHIPWWMACSRDTLHETGYIFNPQQQKILIRVQNFLFPSDDNGPGASEVFADAYLQWVLLDPKMDTEEKDYILNGLAWVEETANEEEGKSFLKLTTNEQSEILKYIGGENWGESWFSILINFILEALLSDPIYGSNPEKIAWEWLHHNPGFPRPNEEQKYGQFLYYVNTNTQTS